ncbi:MAG: ectonucleotide pyrophosphatase/phosphodiesterase [Caulobacteraceae bacterium]|nr:ectonucleotide pyrophosphatase/phosphodiesterase [Caulobacteraceae bacterium]
MAAFSVFAPVQAAPQPAVPIAASTPAAYVPLILFSIDGIRWDYLNRGVSPTLSALAAGGVRAERMLPSYPSITFPNHYTLVTGLYPDHHGIVANTFQDPAAPGGVFHMSSKDEAWWDEGTPLWVSAERQGLPTATEFWPGSESAIHGVRPSHWEPFNQGKRADQRVDSLLAWLDLPAERKPRFLSLYFDAVDTAGHFHGPDSEAVNTAVAATDTAIGHLIEGLKARGIAANLIVVSDHGMAAVAPDHTVWLDDVVDPAAVHVVFADAVSGVDIPETAAGHVAEAKLLAPHEHMTCWDKAKVPARLHYGTNPRVPDVVCMGEVGWLIETRAEQARRHFHLQGEHGYDNTAPEMGALFIANGPAFKAGTVIPPFPNVDVYPLMAKVLGVKAERNDGDLAGVRGALAGR